MKVSFGNLLGWGGGKEKGGKAPSVAELRDGLSNLFTTKDRRGGNRFKAEGRARIFWTDQTGNYHAEAAQFLDINDRGAGIGVKVGEKIPSGSPVWLVGENHEPWAAIVRHSRELEGGWLAGLDLEIKPQDTRDFGAATMRWVDLDETCRSVSASLRNSAEGLMEIVASVGPPRGRVVIVEGGSVSCICVARRSEVEGERYVTEVETMEDLRYVQVA